MGLWAVSSAAHSGESQSVSSTWSLLHWFYNPNRGSLRPLECKHEIHNLFYRGDEVGICGWVMTGVKRGWEEYPSNPCHQKATSYSKSLAAPKRVTPPGTLTLV